MNWEKFANAMLVLMAVLIISTSASSAVKAFYHYRAVAKMDNPHPTARTAEENEAILKVLLEKGEIERQPTTRPQSSGGGRGRR